MKIKAARDTRSVSMINLPPVSRVNHIHNQLSMVNAINNAVIANPEPQKPLMTF